jgi:small-conductance mechanosensitive channel
MQEFLDQVYYNNTVKDYLLVLFIIVFSILLLRAFKRVIIKRLRILTSKTAGATDDFIVDGVDRFGLPIVQFALIYWGIDFLVLSVHIENIIEVATSVIITYYFLRLLSSVITMLLESRIRRKEHGEQKIKQLGGLMLLINIVVWVIGIVFLLDNLGKDVTTIIAGLGIGGIAIALAAQNILGDLFNYFVIYFDRPFEVGDFIIFDDKLGTVEYLGIKTTRIRCLSGEQLIVGNSNLTSSRIHNYKRMYERRIVFNLNVDFRTPLEKVKIVPGLLKSIVQEQKMTRFDRAHFSAYGDWSLRFEVVYYVLSPDYNVYMDIQQTINFRINEELTKNEIYFVTGFHISMAPQPEKPEGLKKYQEKKIKMDHDEPG